MAKSIPRITRCGASISRRETDPWRVPRHIGPLLVVGLMALAIVARSLPSARMAVASGAAYGRLWGTPWAVLGNEAAFGLAGLLGRKAMRRWFGERIERSLWARKSC